MHQRSSRANSLGPSVTDPHGYAPCWATRPLHQRLLSKLLLDSYLFPSPRLFNRLHTLLADDPLSQPMTSFEYLIRRPSGSKIPGHCPRMRAAISPFRRDSEGARLGRGQGGPAQDSTRDNTTLSLAHTRTGRLVGSIACSGCHCIRSMPSAFSLSLFEVVGQGDAEGVGDNRITHRCLQSSKRVPTSSATIPKIPVIAATPARSIKSYIRCIVTLSPSPGCIVTARGFWDYFLR